MEEDKGGKVCVWTDLLIIAVLYKFVLQRLPSSTFGPLVVLAFIIFLGLRSRYIHSVMRNGLSIAAVAAFSIDIYYSLGPSAFTIFIVGLGSLFLFHFIMRRFLGFFIKQRFENCIRSMPKFWSLLVTSVLGTIISMEQNQFLIKSMADNIQSARETQIPG